LKGLGDVFGTVRTQILLMESLPSINRVFSMVIQQERNLSGVTQNDSKVLLNNVKQQNGKEQVHGERKPGRGRRRNYSKQCSF